jgi:hypothetical protein
MLSSRYTNDAYRLDFTESGKQSCSSPARRIARHRRHKHISILLPDPENPFRDRSP